MEIPGRCLRQLWGNLLQPQCAILKVFAAWNQSPISRQQQEIGNIILHRESKSWRCRLAMLRWDVLYYCRITGSRKAEGLKRQQVACWVVSRPQKSTAVIPPNAAQPRSKLWCKVIPHSYEQCRTGAGE